MRKNKLSQSVIEYVVLFVIVIIVLWFFMGIYLRNSLSGTWRSAADSIGEGEVFYPNKSVTQVYEHIRAP